MNRFIGRPRDEPLHRPPRRVGGADVPRGVGRAGSGGLLIISGEAGIGKTRLVEGATRIAMAHPLLTKSILMLLASSPCSTLALTSCSPSSPASPLALTSWTQPADRRVHPAEEPAALIHPFRPTITPASPHSSTGNWRICAPPRRLGRRTH